MKISYKNAETFYWSATPGKFVNKRTGRPVVLSNNPSIGPRFTGSVHEWYETLVETIIDASNHIRRLSKGQNTIDGAVVTSDVARILETSVLCKRIKNNILSLPGIKEILVIDQSGLRGSFVVLHSPHAVATVRVSDIRTPVHERVTRFHTVPYRDKRGRDRKLTLRAKVSDDKKASRKQGNKRGKLSVQHVRNDMRSKKFIQ